MRSEKKGKQQSGCLESAVRCHVMRLSLSSRGVFEERIAEDAVDNGSQKDLSSKVAVFLTSISSGSVSQRFLSLRMNVAMFLSLVSIS